MMDIFHAYVSLLEGGYFSSFPPRPPRGQAELEEMLALPEAIREWKVWAQLAGHTAPPITSPFFLPRRMGYSPYQWPKWPINGGY